MQLLRVKGLHGNCGPCSGTARQVPIESQNSRMNQRLDHYNTIQGESLVRLFILRHQPYSCLRKPGHFHLLWTCQLVSVVLLSKRGDLQDMVGFQGGFCVGVTSGLFQKFTCIQSNASTRSGSKLFFLGTL